MKNTTEEKREAIPNSVSRMLLAGIGVLLQVLWIFWLALKLNDYSTAIQVCTSVLTFLITLRIYGLHINSAYKISWIILILLFPIFGLTIYLLFGRSGAVSVMRRRFGENMTMLCRYHAPILQQRRALPYPDRITRNHARYLQDRAGYPAYDNTDVTFYGDTCEALEAQKTALRSAEKFIFMEYHAIEDASAWQELEDILAERAAHGVEVRVFYDDVGSIGFINSKFVKKLAGRGIQCRRFNPVIPILNVFMNNRDHRKITVVDGRVGFTGGYNLADEYFKASDAKEQLERELENRDKEIYGLKHDLIDAKMEKEKLMERIHELEAQLEKAQKQTSRQGVENRQPRTAHPTGRNVSHPEQKL